MSAMRIWHQSMTVLEDLPAYRARIEAHARKVLRPDTEVVLHGLAPDTYPGDYPGDDIAYSLLFRLHAQQWLGNAWKAQKEGYDGFAMCTMVDPLLREIRTLVDLPVVGCAESCFLTAPMFGERFGMLLFIDRMAPLYRDIVRSYGLAERCVGIVPVGFGFRDVLDAFGNPGPLIDRFRAAARKLIDAGADVIIPGEIPMNLLMASEGVNRVDDAPVIDSLGLTLKMTETLVELRRSTGLAPSRRGFYGAAPRAERAEQVLRYYGLGRFLS
jgi:Asp/Glu/hydantoin racemase